MRHRRLAVRAIATLLILGSFIFSEAGQTRTQTRADVLRGEYSRYRANNDLLYYHLDIRVDPDKKFISGKNTIRFKMLQDDTRIQLDLVSTMNVDKILLGKTPLKFERDLNTVFVDFPEPQKAESTVSIDFYYSGMPQETGRFGGLRSRRIRLDIRGLTLPAKGRAHWSGGRTKISGVTKSRRWKSALRFRTILWTCPTGSS